MARAKSAAAKKSSAKKKTSGPKSGVSTRTKGSRTVRRTTPRPDIAVPPVEEDMAEGSPTTPRPAPRPKHIHAALPVGAASDPTSYPDGNVPDEFKDERAKKAKK
jgi:hypothetical protein